MTTEVEVRANHGWAVRVTLIHKAWNGADPEPQILILAAGERRTLYISDHLDMHLHEIQPDEKAIVEPVVIQAVGEAQGVATTGEAEAEVVPRVVTGYIEPITADKIRL